MSIDAWINPTPEDLDPELEEWLEPSSTFGLLLKHPLVYAIPYHKQMNQYVNQQYRIKKKAIELATRDNDWYTVLFLHERPYRLDAFRDIEDQLDNIQYWSLLADIWTDSENIRENYYEWEDMLTSERAGREHMMDVDEQEALADLPDIVTVYQGHTDQRDDGWSWTTDLRVAERFARRFATLEEALPLVSEATVAKSNITAYLLGRSEHEVIVDPDHVYVHHTTPLIGDT